MQGPGTVVTHAQGIHKHFVGSSFHPRQRMTAISADSNVAGDQPTSVYPLLREILLQPQHRSSVPQRCALQCRPSASVPTRGLELTAHRRSWQSMVVARSQSTPDQRVLFAGPARGPRTHGGGRCAGPHRAVAGRRTTFRYPIHARCFHLGWSACVGRSHAPSGDDRSVGPADRGRPERISSVVEARKGKGTVPGSARPSTPVLGIVATGPTSDGGSQAPCSRRTSRTRATDMRPRCMRWRVWRLGEAVVTGGWYLGSLNPTLSLGSAGLHRSSVCRTAGHSNQA